MQIRICPNILKQTPIITLNILLFNQTFKNLFSFKLDFLKRLLKVYNQILFTSFKFSDAKNFKKNIFFNLKGELVSVFQLKKTLLKPK